MARRSDLLLAAASGLVLGAAFLPHVPGWIAWAAFVPLLLGLERRVATGTARSWFALGYAGGFAFFLVGTHWIALLSDVALTIGWLKYLGWVLAAFYLAAYWGLATTLAGWLARRSRLSAAWTFAVAMLVVEEFRSAGELGFPWFQPGYSQAGFLPAVQLASLGSITLVTLWVLLVNGAVARALATRHRAQVGLALALLAVPLAWGGWELRGRGQPAGPLVALVQGNIPGEIKWSGNHTVEIFRTFLGLCDSAAAQRPRLYIWPETATGTYVRRYPEQSMTVASLAARVEAPIYMGFAHWTWDSAGKPVPWNAAGGWNPDGSLSRWYAKRHLVPFGERMPFEKLVPALAHVDLGQAEWMPGRGTVLFPGPAGPMSFLICFESIFPDLARADVRAGSRLLVNITNDEWFGNGAALQQHAEMAPFRAAEHHVPLARCANTGITEMIDAYGGVTARLPVFESRVLVTPLPAVGRPTLYTHLGDWPGALAVVASLLLAWSPWRRRALTPAEAAD